MPEDIYKGQWFNGTQQIKLSNELRYERTAAEYLKQSKSPGCKHPKTITAHQDEDPFKLCVICGEAKENKFRRFKK